MSAKRILTAVMAVLVAAVLTACSCSRSAQLAKPAMAEGAEPVEVTGSCSAQLINGGDNLRVSGTCNLMNGTNGILSVLNANGSLIEEHKFTKDSEEVSYDFEVGKDWPEVVYGFMSFDTQQADSQPDEVKDAYGRQFQNLEGEDVIWDLKGVIAVFQSEAVEIPQHIGD